jgi:Gluconate 2-dehydrogenase subunit 3
MGEPRFGLTRRELLQAGSAALIASQLPVVAWRNARAEAACEPRPRFFSDPEDYRTLEALVDRLIPEDTDTSGAVSYGAKRAKVADYVDFFLGSFLCTSATPFLYAGGPFSDRNGSATNDMASPVALTPAQRIAWRVLILGSANAAETPDDSAKLAIIRANNVIAGVGDANGDTEGYQQLFQRLIAALRGSGFADLPAPLQDAMLERPDLIQDVMSAFAIAVEGMYANPEYGANRPPVIAPGNPSGGATGFLDPSNRPIGWTNAFFEGDTQPHGYTTFVPDGPPDANGSAPGHYVETPGHPVSTADPGGVPLTIDAATLAAIQAALSNIRIS